MAVGEEQGGEEVGPERSRSAVTARSRSGSRPASRPAAPPEIGIAADSTITDRRLERRYRQWAFKTEFRTLALLVGAVNASHFAFIGSDLRFLGDQVWPLLIARGVYLLLSSALLFLAWKRRRLAWLSGPVVLLTVALVVYINGTRPSDYLGNVPMDLLVLLTLWLAAPLTFREQAVLAMGFTVVNLGVHHLTRPDIDPLAWRAIVGAYIIGNIIGVVTTIGSQRRRRELFVAAHRQHQVSRRLRKALAEVEELRAIIPICAWCKNVRDDGGYWNTVEEYISHHTGVDLTHSICPTCRDRHFSSRAPEVDAVSDG